MKEISPSPAPNVSQQSQIAARVTVWAGSQIREGAVVGEGTSIGQYCYVGPGVVIGKNCSIQNGVQIFEPCQIRDGVFLGPGVIITNDVNPRATTLSGSRKSYTDWQRQAATIESGASLGAGAICIGSITLGAFSLVAAGSVVTKDVKPFALVAGVPASQISWVGRAGFRLEDKGSGSFECPETGELYQQRGDNLFAVDVPEL